MNKKTFHLGVILSVSQPKLVALGGLVELHDFYEFLVDGNVFHHQINKKLREKCSEQLLAQFPFLLKVDSAHVTGENWKEWLDAQVAEFGEFHEVEPLKNIQMEDPIDSLLKLNPNSVVAVI